MGKKKLIESREELEKLAPIANAPVERHVLVCTGKSCLAVGSEEVKEAFEKRLEGDAIRFGKEKKGRNPQGSVVLTECGSVGLCSVGPAVIVYPEGVWYAQVSVDDVDKIVDEHLLVGRVVSRLALIDKFGKKE
jgi:(2Fe-2S) ferredoxin